MKMSVNHLRVYRRRAGLNQTELGMLLGYQNESAVRKHERFQTIPPFLIALGYEVIFRVPASELFPGIVETVALGIEMRLAELEREMRESGEGEVLPPAALRKLNWLEARRRTVTDVA